MKVHSINEQARSAAVAGETEYFNMFIEKAKTYPSNIPFTIEQILGYDTWRLMQSNEKIKLGKAISANIECGNLKGIEATNKVPGKAKNYVRVGDVRMSTFFFECYKGAYYHIQDVFKENTDVLGGDGAFIKCYKRSINDENGNIVLKCEFLDKNGNLIQNAEFERIVNKEFFEKNILVGKNYEFHAILALWYGYDRVYENQNLLKKIGIKNIGFLAPNDQIMQHIAGYTFNSAYSKYDYTEFIQNIFYEFSDNGLRRLPFSSCIISLTNNELNKKQ